MIHGVLSPPPSSSCKPSSFFTLEVHTSMQSTFSQKATTLVESILLRFKANSSSAISLQILKIGPGCKRTTCMNRLVDLCTLLDLKFENWLHRGMFCEAVDVVPILVDLVASISVRDLTLPQNLAASIQPYPVHTIISYKANREDP
jgi:hypothetical protein